MPEQLDIHMQKKKNLYTDLISFTKILNGSFINIKCKTVKLKKVTEENLSNLVFGNEFLVCNTKSMMHERKKVGLR